MSIATFGGVEIPAVSALEVGREFIGQRRRTLDGTMRQDKIAVKRIWKLGTSWLTKAEADALLNQLAATNWAAGAFGLDEFGVGVTVQAYIPPEDITEERGMIGRDGVWHPDARKLTLTVIEQ
jgi:hypothetical protein